MDAGVPHGPANRRPEVDPFFGPPPDPAGRSRRSGRPWFGVPHPSRNELAKILCEPLHWTTAKGGYWVGACLGMLERLERQGILTLPPVREDPVRDLTSAPVRTSASDPQPEIVASRSELRPLRVEPVPDPAGRQLGNTFVDRHPHLGDRRPFGARIRSFVTDRQGCRLGCIRFEAGTKTLPCRDRGIGCTDRRRDRNRHRRTVHSRYLGLPWLSVPNLGSHILAIMRRRLPDDWTRRYNLINPVLIETFVRTPRYTGAVHTASGWICVGTTKGRGRYNTHNQHNKPKKDIWLRPLRKNWKRSLNR